VNRERKEIASLECNTSSVPDVVYVLQQLEGFAPLKSEVGVEMQHTGDVHAATLYEDTLTDGSKVYQIQLR
jgi:hypothetical protein